MTSSQAKKDYNKRYYAANKAKFLEAARASREKAVLEVGSAKEYNAMKYAKQRANLLVQKRAFYAANRELMIQRQRVQRAKRKALISVDKKKYAQENREIINSLIARRRAAKKQRSPMWVDAFDLECMRSTYTLAALLTEHTGEPWHVDHEIPLCGKVVSGLHVPSNLRAVRGVDNMRKHNTYVVL